jgi:hypothetical protein
VWAAGQNGWRREVGRGVWGNSGREEWARVSKDRDTAVTPLLGSFGHHFHHFHSTAFQIPMVRTLC